jgi:hypothetical protein
MSRLTKGRAVRELTLGLHVEKSLASLAAANIFTTYGRFLITLLYGVVTGAGDGGATTIKLQEETNSVDMCAATTVTGDTVDEIYFLTGDTIVILNGTGAVPVKTLAGVLSAFPRHAMIFGKDGTADAIQIVQTGDDATHVVEWHLFYIPLDDNAYVVAA